LRGDVAGPLGPAGLRTVPDPRLDDAHPGHARPAALAPRARGRSQPRWCSRGRARAPVSAPAPPSPGDASLVTLALDALYERDGRGRMLPPRTPRIVAPRVHFTRTTTANTWCFSAALPDDLVARIEPLLAGEPLQPDSSRWEPVEPACLAAVRAILS